MKNLYKKIPYKNWITQRQERELKRTLQKKEFYNKNKTSILRRKNLYRNLRKKNFEPITFPTNFSIVSEPYELTKFFENIHEKLFLGKPLYFDQYSIERVTLDSMLYTIAIFNDLKNTNTEYFIRSNLPKNPNCREVFLSSGFFNYVLSKKRELIFNDNYFEIKSGHFVDNTTAKEICLFVEKHLGKTRGETKGLFRMLIELMNNTKEHAYLDKTQTSKWFLIARHDFATKIISFSFLDTGVGIPKTISMDQSEKAIELFAEIFSVSKGFSQDYDADLIESALKGEFRTRTEQGYRGKGLPCIYEFSQNNYIQELIILSNYGYIDCNDNLKIKLLDKFHGTLYSWSFK